MAKPRFSTGVNAIAICDHCGMKTRYSTLIKEPETNAWVHPWCLDLPIAPIQRKKYNDAQALHHPRPDRSVAVYYTEWDDGETFWDEYETLWDESQPAQ